MNKRNNSRLVNLNETFRKLAARVSNTAGSPGAFCLAFFIVVAWALSGFYYRWSSNHSLFINTVTTIITFLMVFVLQSSQNRDTKAMLLKLDELIRTSEASNKLIEIETKEEFQINEIRKEIKEEIKKLNED